MSPSVILLILRITGALLLLLFLGAITYFIYRDVQLASRQDEYLVKPRGTLRVLASETEAVQNGDEYQLSVVSDIGRSPVNLVVIDDEFTSGRHALITWSGEQWLVEDVGSRNGTFLNDLPVESQTVMVAGDVITVGRTQFKLDL